LAVLPSLLVCITRKGDHPMLSIAPIRWPAFVAWLRVGICGILPDTLRREFGPIGPALALARQVAAAVSPWLVALLAAQPAAQRVRVSEEDVAPRRALSDWLPQEPSRLRWLLAAELARLVRLAAAVQLPTRQGWLEYEVRFWAQVCVLARLGQLYAALERAEGTQAAQRAWLALAEQVGRQPFAE
jgi:hypothetical protein